MNLNEEPRLSFAVIRICFRWSMVTWIEIDYKPTHMSEYIVPPWTCFVVHQQVGRPVSRSPKKHTHDDVVRRMESLVSDPPPFLKISCIVVCLPAGCLVVFYTCLVGLADWMSLPDGTIHCTNDDTGWIISSPCLGRSFVRSFGDNTIHLEYCVEAREGREGKRSNVCSWVVVVVFSSLFFLYKRLFSSGGGGGDEAVKEGWG